MLGCEALLQPVVEVDAPGGAGFPQLVELAKTTQGHAHRKGLALLVEPHLPVVLAGIDQGVSCQETYSPGVRNTLWPASCWSSRSIFVQIVVIQVDSKTGKILGVLFIYRPTHEMFPSTCSTCAHTTIL